ncbi:hypothetical protein D043_2890A, partial [Vibrio parahaemolyticus EKP-021]
MLPHLRYFFVYL